LGYFAIFNYGRTLTNVVISSGGGGGASNVGWTNTVGVNAATNNLTKTAATAWGNAGAVSTQTIASGDGYVEFTASETNTYRMLGLSHTDTNQRYNTLDYAIYLQPNGLLGGYQGATFLGSLGSYATGDVLRVAIEGGVVKYRKNGTLIYTATVAPNYPLMVDTSLYTNGATINNVVLSGASGGGSSSAQIHWLVTDQLGTPRMVFDQTGSLANLSRHDYLPFGEELGAGVGGRTQSQGYSQPDEGRFQFTSKERDNETGLDYFIARYHSSTAGRFVSADPLAGHTEDPQTLNRYTYTRNNPLKYIDPDGLDFWIKGQGDHCKDKAKCDKDGFVVDEKGKRMVVKNGEITNRLNGDCPKCQQSSGGYTAVVNEAGVQITNMGGQTFTGVFTENAVSLSGAGKLQDFSFTITGSSLQNGVLAGGTFEYSGTNEQTKQVLSKRGAFSYVLDPFNKFHPGTTQYRFADLPPLQLGIMDNWGTIQLQTSNFGTSSHLSVATKPKANVPKTVGEWHVDSATGIRHLGCAIGGVRCQ
jgi:RHS repeat-associated protein